VGAFYFLAGFEQILFEKFAFRNHIFALMFLKANFSLGAIFLFESWKLGTNLCGNVFLKKYDCLYDKYINDFFVILL